MFKAYFRIISLLMIALFLVGCTSGPELKKYPLSQIDRPYTLPKGVATLSLPAIWASARDSLGNQSNIVVPPLPLFWGTSLSDDWELDWLPLPLRVRHQFHYDSTGFSGANLIVGGGYSALSGGYLVPTLGGSYRRKFSSAFALDAAATFTPAIQFSGGPLVWIANLQTFALFQITPTIAVSAGPLFQMGNAVALTSEYFSVISTATNPFTSIPLAANFFWSFDRQWELGVGGRVDIIGQSNGASTQLAYAQATHFW